MMTITTCTKKPHTDPRVLAMASEKTAYDATRARDAKKQSMILLTRGQGQ